MVGVAQFKAWLRSCGRIDVVVDGANVGHLDQNFAGGHFSHAQIDSVVRRQAATRRVVVRVRFCVGLLTPSCVRACVRLCVMRIFVCPCVSCQVHHFASLNLRVAIIMHGSWCAAAAAAAGATRSRRAGARRFQPRCLVTRPIRLSKVQSARARHSQPASPGTIGAAAGEEGQAVGRSAAPCACMTGSPDQFFVGHC